MNTLKGAAQQALEAWDQPSGINYIDFRPYMDALRAALAEMKPCNKSCAPGYCYCECPHGVMVRPKPLSIEQIEEAWDKSNFTGRANISFARAIERAHGIGGEHD